MTHSTRFTIVAGAYERLLYGIECSVAPSSAAPSNAVSETGKRPREEASEDKAGSMTPVFIYPSHISCIKALSCCGRFLTSGSTDELIKIYDLKARKEIGTLMSHDGTITALQFWNGADKERSGHLVSAGEDGKICVYRMKDWELLKTLKGHKSAVRDIAVHPSGKILLSVAAGRVLFCWDLMTGKKAYSLKLRGEAERVRWTQAGFLVLGGTAVDVWDMKTQQIRHTIAQRQRINAVALASIGGREFVATGGEDKALRIYEIPADGDAPTLAPLVTVDGAHAQRVKDMAVHEGLLVTCSTDGAIKAWDLSAVASGRPAVACVAEYNAGTRLVCVGVSPQVSGQRQDTEPAAKKQRVDEEETVGH
jgi:WD40 repeat protein